MSSEMKHGFSKNKKYYSGTVYEWNLPVDTNDDWARIPNIPFLLFDNKKLKPTSDASKLNDWE